MEEFEGKRRGMLITGEWCNYSAVVWECSGSLGMLAAFWAGMPVEVTQEAGCGT